MKRTNTRVHRNGGSTVVLTQVPNSTDRLPASPEQERDSLVKLAQDSASDPAVRAVVNEWLAGVPIGCLENLAGLLRSAKGRSTPPSPNDKAATTLFNEWDAKGVALLLMTGSEAGPEREIAGLNYSEAEFEQIKRVAESSGQTLGAFLLEAIEARLNRPPAGDLEEALDQAKALNALLEHQVLHPEDGEWNADLKNGLVLLGIETFRRLDNAAAAVRWPAQVNGGGR